MAQNIASKINPAISRIPVDQIIHNPEDLRKDEPVDMSLLTSLKKSGQAEPGIFRVDESGQRIIVSGNRRLTALKMLQENLRSNEVTKNQIIYWEGREFTGNVQEARQLVALANSYRKDFSLRQKVALVLKYQAEGMDVKEIALAFGMKNPTEVYNLVKVSESADAATLYEATETGVITETTAKQLAKNPEVNVSEKIEKAKEIAKGIATVAKAKKPKQSEGPEGAGGKPEKKKKVSASALLGRYSTQTNLTTDDWKAVVAHKNTPEVVSYYIMALIFDEDEALKQINYLLPNNLENGHSVNPALAEAKKIEAAQSTQLEEAPKSEALSSDDDDSEEAQEEFAQSVAE